MQFIQMLASFFICFQSDGLNAINTKHKRSPGVFFKGWLWAHRFSSTWYDSILCFFFFFFGILTVPVLIRRSPSSCLLGHFDVTTHEPHMLHGVLVSSSGMWYSEATIWASSLLTATELLTPLDLLSWQSKQTFFRKRHHEPKLVFLILI